MIASERRLAAKQLANGRVIASDLGAQGDPDEQRDTWRRTVASGIDELLPILSFVSFPVLASGLYDVTPDHQPLLGEVDEGLWVAAGFSGHGFMLAPVFARRLAAAIVRNPVDDVLEQFAPDRFERGAISAERRVI